MLQGRRGRDRVEIGDYCSPVAEGDLCLPGDSKESLVRRIGHEVYYKNKPKPSEKEGQADPDEAPHENDDEDQQPPATPADVRPEQPPSAKDYWTLQGDMLIRHHRRQRLKLFIPDDQNMPIPLRYVDVIRNTETSLESPSEKNVMDYWNVTSENLAGDPMPADRRLSEPWTGRTIFHLLRQPLPDGWEWVLGRPAKKQTSNRPPTIWPEFWKALSTKQKEQAVK